MGLQDGGYLEFLAIDDENVTFSSSGQSYSFGITRETCLIPQTLTWAVRATSIASARADSQTTEQNKSDLEVIANQNSFPIREGSRTLSTGAVLEWRMTRESDQDAHGGVLPFLIDWLQTPTSIHPGQTSPSGCRLVSLRIVTPRPSEIAQKLQNRRVANTLVEKGPKEELVVKIATPNGKVVELGNWMRSLVVRRARAEEGTRFNEIYSKIRFFLCDPLKDDMAVAELGGEWIGVGRVAATSDPTAMELAGIWVDDRYRGRGIARMIVSLLMETVSTLPPGVSVFCVPFRKLNAFYAQYGFQEYEIAAPDVPTSVKSKCEICLQRFVETPISLLKQNRSKSRNN